MNKVTDNHEIVKNTGFSLLAEGTSLKVKADGYSMYPAIKPGSVIFIEPLAENLPPAPGEIIAWKRDTGFVVHRLVRITKKENKIDFITRGDSCAYEDLPITIDLVAGKVIRVDTASGSIWLSGDELMRKPAYLYNRLTVWFLFKLKRLASLIRK